MFWVERGLKAYPVDTFHWPRWPQAPSNLALNLISLDLVTIKLNFSFHLLPGRAHTQEQCREQDPNKITKDRRYQQSEITHVRGWESWKQKQSALHSSILD